MPSSAADAIIEFDHGGGDRMSYRYSATGGPDGGPYIARYYYSSFSSYVYDSGIWREPNPLLTGGPVVTFTGWRNDWQTSHLNGVPRTIDVQQAYEKAVAARAGAVERTDEPNRVYGTDENGEQTVIPIGNIYVNDSYSTSEIDTGKKWTDGKPIYRRNLKGTFTAATNTQAAAALSGVSSLVASGGWWNMNTTDIMPATVALGSSRYSFVWQSAATISFATIAEIARSAMPYEVWVEYTKL